MYIPLGRGPEKLCEIISDKHLFLLLSFNPATHTILQLSHKIPPLPFRTRSIPFRTRSMEKLSHPVRLSLSARLISRGTVFFSHNKTARGGL
jgi:hypothetical protein